MKGARGAPLLSATQKGHRVVARSLRVDVRGAGGAPPLSATQEVRREAAQSLCVDMRGAGGALLRLFGDLL